MISQILVPIITGTVCLAFGALIAYFFKSVSEKGEVDTNLRAAMRETLQDVTSIMSDAMSTHNKIHHTKSPEEIVKEVLVSHTRDVDAKFEKRDLQMDQIRKDSQEGIGKLGEEMSNVRASLRVIELQFVKLVSHLDNEGLSEIISDLSRARSPRGPDGN